MNAMTGIEDDIASSDRDPESERALNLTWDIEKIDSQTYKYRILSRTSVDDVTQEKQQSLTFQQVMELFEIGNYYFINSYINQLKSFISNAYYFECIPTTKSSYHKQPFEFVLIVAPPLEHVHGDSGPFSEHFESSRKGDIISFTNLGKDAKLVVPCPSNEKSVDDFAHLGRFMNSQANEKLFELWTQVGKTFLSIVRDPSRDPDEKLWLSTSGLGVYWLHIRFDKRPKYYNYKPYKI